MSNSGAVLPVANLDSSVVVGALFPGTSNSEVCQSTCARLVNERSRVLYSQALRLDYARAVRRLATKPERLTQEMFEANRLREWGTNPLVRQLWFARAARLLEDLIAQFWETDELPITHGIWLKSVEIMAVESLDATDAIHISSARAFGVNDFVTADADFRRITTPRIHLLRDEAP